MEEDSISIKDLKDYWNLDEEYIKQGQYVAKKDIDAGNNLDNYNLNVFPEPWWGNIKNPDIIVLAINPSYSRGADELDTAVFRNILDKNLDSKFENGVDLFGNDYKTNDGILFKYSSVSEWWRKIFEGIIPSDIHSDNDIDLLKKVGIFNLVGYHSKDTKKLNTNLETTKIMVKYINQLLNGENKLCIIVWGKPTWISNGMSLGKTKDVVLNKNSRESKKKFGNNKYPIYKIISDNDNKLPYDEEEKNILQKFFCENNDNLKDGVKE